MLQALRKLMRTYLTSRAELDRSEEWRPLFAWLPIPVAERKCVFLGWVEVRTDGFFPFNPYYIHQVRRPGALEGVHMDLVPWIVMRDMLLGVVMLLSIVLGVWWTRF